MALFDEDEATELRELFASMDDSDAEEASEAMAAVAKMLRRHDFSFRHIVQEIDARGLLLPAKIGAAIKLMDSTTLAEAKSAFSGARRLMKGCGLTFADIIGALDRQPVRDDDIQDLKLAYRLEVERSREMEAELQKLRANAAAVAAAAALGAMPAPTGEPPAPSPAAVSPFRNLMVAGTLLLGIVLAASIVSTFADLFRSANATATAAGAVPTATPAVVRRSLLSPSGASWNCWRNRGTQGPCF